MRLRCAGIIKCDEVIKDNAGNVTELRCTFDPDHSRKVKGTIHWVSAERALSAEVRLYDHLCAVENPENVSEGQTFLDNLNPNSLQTITAFVEPSLNEAMPGTHIQFERLGYFFVDPVDSAPEKPVFNRTATLRDSWAKMK